MGYSQVAFLAGYSRFRMGYLQLSGVLLVVSSQVAFLNLEEMLPPLDMDQLADDAVIEAHCVDSSDSEVDH